MIFKIFSSNIIISEDNFITTNLSTNYSNDIKSSETSITKSSFQIDSQKYIVNESIINLNKIRENKEKLDEKQKLIRYLINENATLKEKLQMQILHLQNNMNSKFHEEKIITSSQTDCDLNNNSSKIENKIYLNLKFPNNFNQLYKQSRRKGNF